MMLSLKVFDFASIAQGQGEFIYPFEQAFMPKGIHVEGTWRTHARSLHRARGEIN